MKALLKFGEKLELYLYSQQEMVVLIAEPSVLREIMTM
jgi:hypothetical protein